MSTTMTKGGVNGKGVGGEGDVVDRCFALSCNRTTNHELLLDRRAVNENRKSNKPLLEKKRRARINRSLDQLKNLLMDVIKNDSTTSYSKLEKADILEMTVKHLRQIQTKQLAASSSSSSPSSVNPSSPSSVQLLHRYQTGFNACAQEVNRFLLSIDSIQPEVRIRLINHLADCITTPQQPNHSSTTSQCINTPHYNDMRCVIDRMPVTCSNVIHPLTTSQMMQLSPVAMEQLRFRDVIGRTTSAYDVIASSENGCAFGSTSASRVNGVAAHARHRRDELAEVVAEGGEVEMLRSYSMNEEMRIEENEILNSPPHPPSSLSSPPTPPLSVVRGKWRPLVERNNNNNWQNISLNNPTTTSSIKSNSISNKNNSSSSICSPPPPQNLIMCDEDEDDDDDENCCSHGRLNLLPLIRKEHFDAKEEPVWRPW